MIEVHNKTDTGGSDNLFDGGLGDLDKIAGVADVVIENKTLKNQNKLLTTEAQSLSGEKIELENQLRAKTSALNAMVAEKNEVNRQLGIAITSVNDLSTQLQTLQAANNSNESEIDALNANLFKKNNEVSSLENVVSSLSERLATAQEECKVAQAQLDTIQWKITDAVARYQITDTNIAAQIESLVNLFDTTKLELADTKRVAEVATDQNTEQVSQLNASIDEKNAEIQRLEDRISVLQNTRTDTQHAITELKGIVYEPKPAQINIEGRRILCHDAVQAIPNMYTEVVNLLKTLKIHADGLPDRLKNLTYTEHDIGLIKTTATKQIDAEVVKLKKKKDEDDSKFEKRKSEKHDKLTKQYLRPFADYTITASALRDAISESEIKDAFDATTIASVPNFTLDHTRSLPTEGLIHHSDRKKMQIVSEGSKDMSDAKREVLNKRKDAASLLSASASHLGEKRELSALNSFTDEQYDQFFTIPPGYPAEIQKKIEELTKNADKANQAKAAAEDAAKKATEALTEAKKQLEEKNTELNKAKTKANTDQNEIDKLTNEKTAANQEKAAAEAAKATADAALAEANKTIEDNKKAQANALRELVTAVTGKESTKPLTEAEKTKINDHIDALLNHLSGADDDKRHFKEFIQKIYDSPPPPNLTPSNELKRLSESLEELKTKIDTLTRPTVTEAARGTVSLDLYQKLIDELLKAKDETIAALKAAAEARPGSRIKIGKGVTLQNVNFGDSNTVNSSSDSGVRPAQNLDPLDTSNVPDVTGQASMLETPVEPPKTDTDLSATEGTGSTVATAEKAEQDQKIKEAQYNSLVNAAEEILNDIDDKLETSKIISMLQAALKHINAALETGHIDFDSKATIHKNNIEQALEAYCTKLVSIARAHLTTATDKSSPLQDRKSALTSANEAITHADATKQNATEVNRLRDEYNKARVSLDSDIQAQKTTADTEKENQKKIYDDALNNANIALRTAKGKYTTNPLDKAAVTDLRTALTEYQKALNSGHPDADEKAKNGKEECEKLIAEWATAYIQKLRGELAKATPTADIDIWLNAITAARTNLTRLTELSPAHSDITTFKGEIDTKITERITSVLADFIAQKTIAEDTSKSLADRLAAIRRINEIKEHLTKLNDLIPTEKTTAVNEATTYNTDTQKTALDNKSKIEEAKSKLVLEASIVTTQRIRSERAYRIATEIVDKNQKRFQSSRLIPRIFKNVFDPKTWKDIQTYWVMKYSEQILKVMNDNKTTFVTWNLSNKNELSVSAASEGVSNTLIETEHLASALTVTDKDEADSTTIGHQSTLHSRIVADIITPFAEGKTGNAPQNESPAAKVLREKKWVQSKLSTILADQSIPQAERDLILSQLHATANAHRDTYKLSDEVFGSDLYAMAQSVKEYRAAVTGAGQNHEQAMAYVRDKLRIKVGSAQTLSATNTLSHGENILNATKLVSERIARWGVPLTVASKGAILATLALSFATGKTFQSGVGLGAALITGPVGWFAGGAAVVGGLRNYAEASKDRHIHQMHREFGDTLPNGNHRYQNRHEGVGYNDERYGIKSAAELTSRLESVTDNDAKIDAYAQLKARLLMRAEHKGLIRYTSEKDAAVEWRNMHVALAKARATLSDQDLEGAIATELQAIQSHVHERDRAHVWSKLWRSGAKGVVTGGTAAATTLALQEAATLAVRGLETLVPNAVHGIQSFAQSVSIDVPLAGRITPFKDFLGTGPTQLERLAAKVLHKDPSGMNPIGDLLTSTGIVGTPSNHSVPPIPAAPGSPSFSSNQEVNLGLQTRESRSITVNGKSFDLEIPSGIKLAQTGDAFHLTYSDGTNKHTLASDVKLKVSASGLEIESATDGLLTKDQLATVFHSKQESTNILQDVKVAEYLEKIDKEIRIDKVDYLGHGTPKNNELRLMTEVVESADGKKSLKIIGNNMTKGGSPRLGDEVASHMSGTKKAEALFNFTDASGTHHNFRISFDNTKGLILNPNAPQTEVVDIITNSGTTQKAPMRQIAQFLIDQDQLNKLPKGGQITYGTGVLRSEQTSLGWTDPEEKVFRSIATTINKPSSPLPNALIQTTVAGQDKISTQLDLDKITIPGAPQGSQMQPFGGGGGGPAPAINSADLPFPPLAYFNGYKANFREGLTKANPANIQPLDRSATPLRTPPTAPQPTTPVENRADALAPEPVVELDSASRITANPSIGLEPHHVQALERIGIHRIADLANPANKERIKNSIVPPKKSGKVAKLAAKVVSTLPPRETPPHEVWINWATHIADSTPGPFDAPAALRAHQLADEQRYNNEVQSSPLKRARHAIETNIIGNPKENEARAENTIISLLNLTDANMGTPLTETSTPIIELKKLQDALQAIYGSSVAHGSETPTERKKHSWIETRAREAVRITETRHAHALKVYQGIKSLYEAQRTLLLDHTTYTKNNFDDFKTEIATRLKDIQRDYNAKKLTPYDAHTIITYIGECLTAAKQQVDQTIPYQSRNPIRLHPLAHQANTTDS